MAKSIYRLTVIFAAEDVPVEITSSENFSFTSITNEEEETDSDKLNDDIVKRHEQETKLEPSVVTIVESSFNSVEDELNNVNVVETVEGTLREEFTLKPTLTKE